MPDQGIPGPATRGDRYHVAQTTDGIYCECPDYVFHRADYDLAHVDRGCKHIKGMLAVGLPMTHVKWVKRSPSR